MSQKRIAQALKASLIGVLLGLVGYVDATTGYEISVFPLYALPISLAVLFFGMPAGIAVAGTAGVVWFWADVAAGHLYSKPWIVYVNTGSRLVFFLFVALAVGSMIRTLRRDRAQPQNFSALPVCAGCSKVRDRDGYWWEVKVYLREHGSAVTQSRLCPDCAHEAYATQTTLPVSQ